MLDELARLGWRVAVAESLTGGLLAAEIVAVPGASRVLLGGVVAYAADSKAQVLGVDSGLLADRGPVDPEVALQMAHGVRGLFGADAGISTTGVAGPQGQGGKGPGRVYVAVETPQQAKVRELNLAGDRRTVRAAAVAAALDLGGSILRRATPGGREQS